MSRLNTEAYENLIRSFPARLDAYYLLPLFYIFYLD